MNVIIKFNDILQTMVDIFRKDLKNVQKSFITELRNVANLRKLQKEENSQEHHHEFFLTRIRKRTLMNKERLKNLNEDKIKKSQNLGMRTRGGKRKKNEEDIEDINQKIRNINQENEELVFFQVEVNNEFSKIKRYIEHLRPHLPQNRPQNRPRNRPVSNKDVTPAVARVKNFQYFPADESMAGKTCLLGTTDVEVGTEMVSLNCEGRHVFCKQCMDKWFKDNNTCPLCRQPFI